MTALRLLLPLAAGAVLLAGPAAAEITVTAPTNMPALGSVIAGTGSNTFSISTAGAVTQTAGTGVRLSSAGVTAPTVTVSCGLLNLDNLCLLRAMRITVTPNASTNGVSITQLRVGGLSGATYYGSVAPVAGSTVTFVLNPITLTTISFKVGMDVTVAAGASPGPKDYGYTVTAAFVP